MSVKFCICKAWLESLVDFDFLEIVTSYKTLSDKDLRLCLEKEAKIVKTIILVDALNKLVAENLKMDMANVDAKARVRDFFASYYELL